MTKDNNLINSRLPQCIGGIFILFSLIFVIMTFRCEQYRTAFIGAASTFATLAGAILVFSTLENQRKALDIERNKIQSDHFDSRFYRILDSFRNDAANMEITGPYLVKNGVKRGQETSMTRKGDEAFSLARQIFEAIKKGINDDSLNDFNLEEHEIELEHLHNISRNIDENSLTAIEDLDSLNEKYIKYISSQQIPYLLYKYKISKEDKQNFKNTSIDVIQSTLCKKLMDQQPTILKKYLNSLWFILHIIHDLPKGIPKKDYYYNVTCLLGKEELEFLKCFNEFNIITNISY